MGPVGSNPVPTFQPGHPWQPDPLPSQCNNLGRRRKEDHPRTWIRGENNHGDCCCPLRIGLFPMAELHGLYMGATNHLLTGMILQVVGGFNQLFSGSSYSFSRVYCQPKLCIMGKSLKKYHTSWWLRFPPILKNMLVKLDLGSFPQVGRGEHKT